MALATGLGVVVLSPGSAATVPWHKANFGNALVQNLCRSKRQSMFCWEPHFWTEPVYINGKGEPEPRATTGKYSEFWAANGPSMKSQIPPMTGPDEGEELPDLAIHLRCGDITTAEDARLYRYPCRSCITESIRPWLKEGWDNATSTAWFIVGGHPSIHAAKEEADEAVRRCNDYILFYVEALSEIGIYPRIVTHRSIDSDFRVFHHAKKVLALMPSSFSFAAKVSNDAGGIQGLRIISNRKSMTDAPWWHQCEAVASGSFADVRFREQINTCGNPDDGRPRIPTKWTPIANISMNDYPASIAATVATTTTSALESA